MKKILITLLFLFLAPSAMAEYKISPYAGLDVFQWDYSETGASVNSTGLRGRFGISFMENLAVEGHITTGGKEDLSAVSSIDFNLGYSLFAKAKHTIKNVTLFGLLGVTNARFASKGLVNTAGGNRETGLSYGAGLDVNVKKGMSITGDYISYLDKSGFDLSALSLGVTFEL